jgi:hypothetical protein
VSAEALEALLMAKPDVNLVDEVTRAVMVRLDARD